MIMVGRSIRFLGVISDVREIAIVVGGWVGEWGRSGGNKMIMLIHYSHTKFLSC
jgi:hypothetical protein